MGKAFFTTEENFIAYTQDGLWHFVLVKDYLVYDAFHTTKPFILEFVNDCINARLDGPRGLISETEKWARYNSGMKVLLREIDKLSFMELRKLKFALTNEFAYATENCLAITEVKDGKAYFRLILNTVPRHNCEFSLEQVKDVISNRLNDYTTTLSCGDEITMRVGSEGFRLWFKLYSVTSMHIIHDLKMLPDKILAFFSHALD